MVEDGFAIELIAAGALVAAGAGVEDTAPATMLGGCIELA